MIYIISLAFSALCTAASPALDGPFAPETLPPDVGPAWISYGIPGWIALKGESPYGVKIPVRIETIQYDPEHHGFLMNNDTFYSCPVTKREMLAIFAALAADTQIEVSLDSGEVRGAINPNGELAATIYGAGRNMADILTGHAFWHYLFSEPLQSSVTQTDVPKKFFFTFDGGKAPEHRISYQEEAQEAKPFTYAFDSSVLHVSALAEFAAFVRTLRGRGIRLTPMVQQLEVCKPLHLMPHPVQVLAIGFEPYDGREVNSSAIAAHMLAQHAPDYMVETCIAPVAWDESKTLLATHYNEKKPNVIIAFGEAHQSFFTIETVAWNRRWTILTDAQGKYADERSIDPDGPAWIHSVNPAYSIATALSEKGYPTHISTDAGGEQCSEMFYAMERMRETNPAIEAVIFAHVPIWDQQTCNAPYLAGFAKSLLDELLINRIAG